MNLLLLLLIHLAILALEVLSPINNETDQTNQVSVRAEQNVSADGKTPAFLKMEIIYPRIYKFYSLDLRHSTKFLRL